MEEPSFPELTTTSSQISLIHPLTNTPGHPTLPFPNWTPKGAAGPQPRISTTRGTWTSLTCLTKACQGSKGKGASAIDRLLPLNPSRGLRVPAAGRYISTSDRTQTRSALRLTRCSTLSKRIHQAGGLGGFEERKVSSLVTMCKRFDEEFSWTFLCLRGKSCILSVAADPVCLPKTA